MNFAACRNISKNNTISESENKRKIIIKNINNNYISSIKVDGCLITTGIKCDWLFECCTTKDNPNNPFEVIYTELKGSDIKHAIEQLETTIKKLRARHQNAQKYSYIISSRVPPATRSSILIAKKSFKTKYATKLEVKNKEVSHTV